MYGGRQLCERKWDLNETSSTTSHQLHPPELDHHNTFEDSVTGYVSGDRYDQ
jgi:hypothetical protein